jgi:hypothetical protein
MFKQLSAAEGGSGHSDLIDPAFIICTKSVQEDWSMNSERGVKISVVFQDVCENFVKWPGDCFPRKRRTDLMRLTNNQMNK